MLAKLVCDYVESRKNRLRFYSRWLARLVQGDTKGLLDFARQEREYKVEKAKPCGVLESVKTDKYQ